MRLVEHSCLHSSTTCNSLKAFPLTRFRRASKQPAVVDLSHTWEEREERGSALVKQLVRRGIPQSSCSMKK